MSDYVPQYHGFIDQLIRILMYNSGAAWFGTSIADGELFQAAVGGAVAVGAFVWWAIVERKRNEAK